MARRESVCLMYMTTEHVCTHTLVHTLITSDLSSPLPHTHRDSNRLQEQPLSVFSREPLIFKGTQLSVSVFGNSS